MHKWYDWKHERTTVLWPILIGDWAQAAGVIRVHCDAAKIPGDYHCAGTIIVRHKEFEVMGFISKGREPGSNEEFKEFYRYLAGLGLKRKRQVRAKDGEVNIIG
jgi:hypothetical protein